MPRLTACLSLLGCALATACVLGPDTGLWSDVELAEYDLLPMFDAGEPHPYWDTFLASTEYSYSEMAVDSQIVASVGQPCTGDPCATDYASFRHPINAYSTLCPPVGCHLYLLRVRNDTLFVARRANVATLFSPFDSPERAAAYLRLMGFYWRGDDATTGLIAERQSGYEFIVLSGSTCGGDVRRHQIRVPPSGSLDELRSRLYEQGDPNCVV